MGVVRGLALVVLVLALFAGAGYLRRSPYYDAIALAYALQSGDPQSALQWIDVPALAASVVDALEEVWIARTTQDPSRSPLSPLQPVFKAAFGVARPFAQRRVEAEIRDLVHKIALGAPDAPVRLPRRGGLPVVAAAVLALVRFEPIDHGRVRMSVGVPHPHLQLVWARRQNRWVVVAADPAWVRHLVEERLVPPRPDASPPVLTGPER